MYDDSHYPVSYRRAGDNDPQRALPRTPGGVGGGGAGAGRGRKRGGGLPKGHE